MKALIYTRQSKHREDSSTHEMQQDACERYARSKGYEVVTVLHEKGKSGRSIAKRPEFKEALSLIEAGKAQVMLVWRWSRFARNTTDGLITVRGIKDAGGKVESALEQVDNSAAGKFSFTMLLALAEMESDVKSEQWKETHARRLANGQCPIGRPVFGYDMVDGFYRPNADAVAVRKLFERYLKGHGAVKLASWLNENGYRGVRGAMWAGISIYKQMEHPAYRGLIRWAGKDWPGAHEPLVSPETWAAYQKRRKSESRIPARSKANTWHLRGLVRCALCGGSMSKVDSRGTVYLRCLNRAMQGATACEGLRIKKDVVDMEAFNWYMANRDEFWKASKAMQNNDHSIELAEAELAAAKDALTELFLNMAKYGVNVDDAVKVRKAAVEAAEGRLSDALAVKGSPFGGLFDREGKFQMPSPLLGLDDEGFGELMRQVIAGVVVLPGKEVLIVPAFTV
jgi:DNA invertase Pin-like site-specific DNA recombinase